jgi:hypothetical protein
MILIRPLTLAFVAVLPALFAVSAARPAHAQPISRLEAGEQEISTEAGLDAGMVTSVGYAAGVALGRSGRTLIPFGEARLLVARPDLHDYAVKLGAQTSVVRAGWFDLSAQFALEVAGTSNTIYEATALRTDVVLLAGHYAPRWFALGEAGHDRAWLTYIKNSDWYRSFYSGAVDGWYDGTAGNLHAGVKGGGRVGAVEVALRAGVVASETLKSLDLPFYATAGAGWRF